MMVRSLLINKFIISIPQNLLQICRISIKLTWGNVTNQRRMFVRATPLQKPDIQPSVSMSSQLPAFSSVSSVKPNHAPESLHSFSLLLPAPHLIQSFMSNTFTQFQRPYSLQLGEMQLELARTLSQITLLSSIDFQHQLQPLRDSPFILKLLGELLSSNLSETQKQLAAVGVNQVIKYRLENDRDQWRSLWPEYLACLLNSPEIEAIAWRHLNILGISLEKLMQEFQGAFCDCLVPIFKDLHFKSKVLIFQTFCYVQITNDAKLIFIRETFEVYMRDAVAFVCSSHEAPPDRDLLKLELAFFENLAEVLGRLSLEAHGQMEDLMINISQDKDIFQLIIEELLFDPSKGRYESVMKHDFTPDRLNELVLSTDVEESNVLKAKTLKVFVSLLAQYDTKSGQQEFDEHKYLLFMEGLTPLVIQHLVTLATHQRQQNKEITQHLLAFLTRACTFNFMLQTFQNNYQKIFYRICLPFLATNPEENELYLTNSVEFINIAEELIEKAGNEKTETVKNAAGAFLEIVTHTVHGSLKFVVQTCIQTIRSILLSETFPEISQARENYDYKPSIDTALTILAIFSNTYLKRPDLCQDIYKNLITIDELLNLQELDKARLLIFLEYNYEQLFHDHREEGRRYLVYADKGIDESETVSECSLAFFQNCLGLGFGDDIWVSLIKRIQSTKSNIFSLLKTIVDEMLNKLPVDRVKELISRVIGRLVSEFRKCQEDSKDQIVKGSKALFSCLNILTSIAEASSYLKQQPSIIDAIWPIFDMFQFSQRIEFQDNILAIFNKILQVEKHISHRHFAFLPHFVCIYQKEGKFGQLLHTVNLLVTKGRDYLLTEPSAREDLDSLLFFLRQTYGVIKNENTLKHILVFYHYIHWQYDTILPLDREFITILLEIYDIQREYLKDETKAAILNFLLLCEYKYGGVDVSIVAENRIEIFRGYQGKLFAGGLRRLIEKQQQEERLLTYLRYSIRLLHFIREIKLAPRLPQPEYYSPPFPETTQLDPFQEICQSLNHIKRTLPPHHYDHILSQLNNQISLGEIKDLLSRRLVDNSLRAIKKVKQ